MEYLNFILPKTLLSLSFHAQFFLLIGHLTLFFHSRCKCLFTIKYPKKNEERICWASETRRIKHKEMLKVGQYYIFFDLFFDFWACMISSWSTISVNTILNVINRSLSDFFAFSSRFYASFPGFSYLTQSNQIKWTSITIEAIENLHMTFE